MERNQTSLGPSLPYRLLKRPANLEISCSERKSFRSGVKQSVPGGVRSEPGLFSLPACLSPLFSGKAQGDRRDDSWL